MVSGKRFFLSGFFSCKLQKGVPQRIVGRGSCNHHRLLSHRMDEFHSPGMEVDASVGIGTRESVLKVPFDVDANFCQLRPDLVVTSGQQLNLQQVVVVGTGQGPVVQEGVFGVESPEGMGVGFVFIGTAGDPVFQGSGRWFRVVVDHCPIDFADLLLLWNILLKRARVLEVRAISTMPLVGRSIRWGSPRKTSPGLWYFSLR